MAISPNVRIVDFGAKKPISNLKIEPLTFKIQISPTRTTLNNVINTPNNFASHRSLGKQWKMPIPICAHCGFLAPKAISNLKIEPLHPKIQINSQDWSKQRLGAFQTTLPLICPCKNDRETVQNDEFPWVWALLARKKS